MGLGDMLGGLFGTKVKTPPARDYGKEMGETLGAQRGISDDLFKAESKYRPKYAGLDQSILQSLFGGGELYSQGAQGLQRAENQAGYGAAAGDIGVMNLFGRSAYDASNQANPLQGQLNQQASQGLQEGYGLDPNYQRQLQQDFRGAMSSRGLGNSPRDAAMEAYTLGRAGSAERRGNQNFAMGVNQGNQQNLMSLLYGPQVNTASTTQGLGFTNTFNPGSLFNPESAYAGSLYANNYNAEANAMNQSANNKAALWSSAAKGAAQGLFGG